MDVLRLHSKGDKNIQDSGEMDCQHRRHWEGGTGTSQSEGLWGLGVGRHQPSSDTYLPQYTCSS